MSDEKTSAVDLVSSAYSQGITDGHPLNRGAGIVDELKEARDHDLAQAELIAFARAFAAAMHSVEGPPDFSALLEQAESALALAGVAQ